MGILIRDGRREEIKVNSLVKVLFPWDNPVEAWIKGRVAKKIACNWRVTMFRRNLVRGAAREKDKKEKEMREKELAKNKERKKGKPKK